MKALLVSVAPDGNEFLYINGEDMRDGNDWPDITGLLQFIARVNEPVELKVLDYTESTGIEMDGESNSEEFWGQFAEWFAKEATEFFGSDVFNSKEFLKDMKGEGS